MRIFRCSAIVVPFVTSHLREGTFHYHFVDLGNARPRSHTVWSAERRFTSYQGRPAMLQVSTYRTTGGTTVDSLVFDRATLRPIWEHSTGAMRASVQFTGVRITGQVGSGDSSDRPIDLATAIPAYAGAIDDVIAQSMPFHAGYTVVLPFYNGGRVEMDSIRVGRREGNAWRVDLVWPASSGRETLWIDATTRAIVRHLYTYRDGTQAELATD